MKIKVLMALLLFGYSGSVFSGELVKNARIVEVANTNNNSKDFAIFVEGGTGICNTSPVYKIIFPESKFQTQSDSSFDRAFSVALAALTTGMTVRIHNFEDDDCKAANFISLRN